MVTDLLLYTKNNSLLKFCGLTILVLVIAIPAWSGGIKLDYAELLTGTDTTVVVDLALDSDENLYLAGYFSGSVDFDLGVGTTIIASQDYNDSFIAKYDKEGALLWVKNICWTP